MNVLVLENEPDAAEVATRELRDAGHTVLSRHEAKTATFPCRGVVNPSTCPVRSQTVDVALAVRVGTRARPTLGEDGARCALAHRIPLVVAGAPLFDPFDDFATRTVDRTYDVVDTCEEAARAPIAALGRRATEAFRAAVEGSGERSARVVVTRRAGRLIARVVGAGAMATQERSRAAVRIMAALREIDRYAAGIDVGFGDDE
jgi:hypothetical protein